MERLRRSKRKEPTIAEQFAQLPAEEQERYRKRAQGLGWPPQNESFHRWTPENLWEVDECLMKIGNSFTSLIDELIKTNPQFQSEINPGKEEPGRKLSWTSNDINKQISVEIAYSRGLTLEKLQLSTSAGKFDTDDQGQEIYLSRTSRSLDFPLDINQSQLTEALKSAYIRVTSWKRGDLTDVFYLRNP